MSDEPPVDRHNWLHHALVGLHVLTHVPALAFALAILAAALLAGWAWSAVAVPVPVGLSAGSLCLLAALGDWAWLAALPRKRISFGPVGPPLTGLIGVRLFLTCVPLIGMAVGFPSTSCLAAGLILHAAASGAIWYATRIEPFRLGVTHVHLFTPKLSSEKPMRLVHISDLHIERITRREQELVERVNQLNADYILLTGDYLNFSYIGEPRAVADARQVLGALRAREGIYAVRGTHQVDPNALLPVLFDGLAIRWLRSEHVVAGQNGSRLAFAGASCTRKREIDMPAVSRALAGVPTDLFTVLLYHTPDLVPQAAAQGVDLYLAGHTHGGQIRLPFCGALMTATDVGKKYEMGRYDAGGMTLYVSRGIGMEGMAAPRVRFLCPPEIVCIDVQGTPTSPSPNAAFRMQAL